MKKALILMLAISMSAMAEDDKKEILQDLICDLSGFEISIRDGIAKQKKLEMVTTQVKVSRSIEKWNNSKKDMDIIVTPKGKRLDANMFEYLALMGRYNERKSNKNIWYENTEDSYEITEISDEIKAPTSIKNIRIDRINGMMTYKSSSIGGYSSIKNLSGKCVKKEDIKVLK
jgi:hypothetical protein